MLAFFTTQIQLKKEVKYVHRGKLRADPNQRSVKGCLGLPKKSRKARKTFYDFSWHMVAIYQDTADEDSSHVQEHWESNVHSNVLWNYFSPSKTHSKRSALDLELSSLCFGKWANT